MASTDLNRLVAAGIETEAAAALFRTGSRLAADAGTVLFRPGDPCSGFIAVAEGAIRVTLLTETGRAVTLYRVGPGQLCLQTFQHLVDGEPYSAQGTAETTVAGVLIPPLAFDRLMADNAAFRRLVLRQVAGRFDVMLRRLEDTAFRPLEQRLARSLLTAARTNRVAATHAEMADEIGSSREVVSRQLQRWAARGLVRVSRGSTELLEPERLRTLAEGNRVTWSPTAGRVEA